MLIRREKEPSRRLIFVHFIGLFWLRANGGLALFFFLFWLFFFLSFARGVAFLQVESGGRSPLFLVGLLAALSHFPFVLFSVECCCMFGCFLFVCLLPRRITFIYMGEYRSEHMHGICCD